MFFKVDIIERYCDSAEEDWYSPSVIRAADGLLDLWCEMYLVVVI